MVKGLVTKQDFENMFPPDELDEMGDRWLIRLRGSQVLRYSISLKILQEAIVATSGLKFLDIGCGQSYFLLKIRELFPGCKYYGVDISENVTRWNKNKYPFIEYKCSALPEVGYPPGSFDIICALEVLYYLDEGNRCTALRNIAEALKPNGLLLVSGVLDGGRQYFAEDRILQAVRELLSIERIEYNYARLYTILEKYLLETFWLLRKTGELLTLPDVNFEQWIVERNTWKTRAALFARRKVIRQVIRLAINTLVWLLKKVLGWEWLPRLCFVLTKRTMGNKGKSHIIILARKSGQIAG